MKNRNKILYSACASFILCTQAYGLQGGFVFQGELQMQAPQVETAVSPNVNLEMVDQMFDNDPLLNPITTAPDKVVVDEILAHKMPIPAGYSFLASATALLLCLLRKRVRT